MEQNASLYLKLYLEAIEASMDAGDSDILPDVLAADPATVPGVLALLSVTTDVSLLEKIGSNPSTPFMVLEQLAEHYEERVKEAVIDNPSTPVEILERLASDSEADIRYYLAENHRIPISVLEILSGDENPYVADRAFRTAQRVVCEASVVDLVSASRIRGNRSESDVIADDASSQVEECVEVRR